ncbi:hypothetical protein BOX15_Mlig031045g2 [Macrostomum lignano]|uniref:Protein-tyrosine-phosphatase n=2 Tax=Macrostomum lignano TaxID=282301 RepID=A0A1I8GZ82_9PLAT|nr:hypothetical protein BOX15_Mlig031045g1 [Macrostomum lignano]PAA84325.1 hypothetical protein BOX15_Mlig031045g2 [Macrostomum lignano]
MSSYLTRFPYAPRAGNSSAMPTPTSSSQYRYSTTNSQYGRFPTNNGTSSSSSGSSRFGTLGSRNIGYNDLLSNSSASSSSVTAALDASASAGIFTQVAQITDHLYLCSAHPVRDARLRALGIKLVVNATIDVPPVRLAGVDTLQVPVDDTPYARISNYFDIVADRINGEIRRGNNVLVHCMAGVSRSATLVLAYLMKYRNLNLRQAHDLCKQRRPYIRPNVGFWRQLCDYEERLFGIRSVRMVTSPVGLVPDVYKDELQSSGLWMPSASTTATAGTRNGYGGRTSLLSRY